MRHAGPGATIAESLFTDIRSKPHIPPRAYMTEVPPPELRPTTSSFHWLSHFPLPSATSRFESQNVYCPCTPYHTLTVSRCRALVVICNRRAVLYLVPGSLPVGSSSTPLLATGQVWPGMFHDGVKATGSRVGNLGVGQIRRARDNKPGLRDFLKDLSCQQACAWLHSLWVEYAAEPSNGRRTNTDQ